MSIHPDLFPLHRGASLEGGSGLDLRNLLMILRRRWRIVAAAIVTCVALALAYLLLVPPSYQASAVVLLDPRQKNVTPDPQVLPGIGGDAAAVESQVELVSATRLIRQTIAELGLADDPEFTQKSMLGRLKALPGDLLGVDRRIDSAEVASAKLIERFKNRLRVERRGLTYLLEIGFVSKDREKAARIANTLAANYLDFLRQAKTDAATDASQWLDARIREMREAVSRSDQAVQAFKARNNIVDLGAAGAVDTLSKRQLEALNQELIMARAATAQARARLDQVRSLGEQARDPGSISSALGSTVIANLRTRYAELARTESEYQLIYGDRHPRLRAVRQQMAEMRQEIAKEIARFQQSAENEYEIARSRERSLAESLEGMEQGSAATDRIRVQLQELEREAAANREIYEQFLQRARETHAQQSLDKPEAQLVSEAIIPLKPTRPGKSLILVVAAVGGVMLGFAGAMAAEAFDTGLRSREAVEDTLRLPCIGLVPQVDLPAYRRGQRPEDRLLRLAIDEPAHDFAESVREVRHRLLATGAKGAPAQVMLISSSLENEGKSSLAANLAHSLAKAGRFTLLVDLDVRSHTLSSQLGGGAKGGLLNVLSGERALSEMAREQPRSGLFVLPLGRIAGDAAETDKLLSTRLEAFIAQCREIFDCVVIDGPPATSGGETQLLFGVADKAVLIAEWGRTSQETMLSALSAIGENRSKVCGIVLNKIDKDALRYYSGAASYYRTAA